MGNHAKELTECMRRFDKIRNWAEKKRIDRLTYYSVLCHYFLFENMTLRLECMADKGKSKPDIKEVLSKIAEYEEAAHGDAHMRLVLIEAEKERRNYLAVVNRDISDMLAFLRSRSEQSVDRPLDEMIAEINKRDPAREAAEKEEEAK